MSPDSWKHYGIILAFNWYYTKLLARRGKTGTPLSFQAKRDVLGTLFCA
jgi:hypothetical protein